MHITHSVRTMRNNIIKTDERRWIKDINDDANVQQSLMKISHPKLATQYFNSFVCCFSFFS